MVEVVKVLEDEEETFLMITNERSLPILFTFLRRTECLEDFS